MKRLSFLFLTFSLPIVMSCSGGSGGNGTNDNNPESKITVEELNKIHTQMKEESIEQLKNIIESNGDKKIREKAIFVLSDIAIKNGKAKEVIPFLEKVAKDNKSIRTVAYANLDLLRETIPPPISLDVHVKNLIKKNSTVLLTFDITSEKPSTIRVMLRKRIKLPEKKLTPDITVKNPIKEIVLGEQNLRGSVNYSINFKETGLFYLEFIVKQDISRTENYQYRKSVLFDVKENTGSYKVY